MKKLLLVALILVSVSCVQTTEKKAQKAVALYLEQNLGDWKSYEPIEFGYPDSSMSTYKEDFALLASDSLLRYARFNAKMAEFDYYIDDLNIKEQKKLLPAIDSLAKTCTEIDSILTQCRSKWYPSFNGWTIKHKYRAKNEQGNYEVFERWFHVYKEFSGAKPIYE